MDSRETPTFLPLPAEGNLGAAYEFATGQKLRSGDFEGGKTGAVRVDEKPISTQEINACCWISLRQMQVADLRMLWLALSLAHAFLLYLVHGEVLRLSRAKDGAISRGGERLAWRSYDQNARPTLW